MNKAAATRIAKILKNSKHFFFATTDGNRPYVRPFNAVVEFEGKVYFYTNNRTFAYKEMQANPFIEVCALVDEEGDRWLRVNGKVEYDHNIEVKRAMLEANPALKSKYHENDKIFHVFYLSNMSATIHSRNTTPEVIC